MEIPKAAASLIVRLDVTRATQLDRLRSRDGLEPDADTLAALDHDSETALDDWPYFDVRVNNDTGTLLADVVTTISEHVFAVQCRRAARQPAATGPGTGSPATSLRDELRKAARLNAERPEWTKRAMPTITGHPVEQPQAEIRATS